MKFRLNKKAPNVGSTLLATLGAVWLLYVLSMIPAAIYNIYGLTECKMEDNKCIVVNTVGIIPPIAPIVAMTK